MGYGYSKYADIVLLATMCLKEHPHYTCKNAEKWYSQYRDQQLVVDIQSACTVSGITLQFPSTAYYGRSSDRYDLDTDTTGYCLFVSTQNLLT